LPHRFEISSLTSPQHNDFACVRNCFAGVGSHPWHVSAVTRTTKFYSAHGTGHALAYRDGFTLRL